MPTIKDIARIAEVSPSTVSFVLNGKARKMKVSPATEQKILKIVAESGYTPNATARKLRANKAERPVLALYWPHDHRANYIGRILNELRKELSKRNMDFDPVIKTYTEGHLCDDKYLRNRDYYDYAVIGGMSSKDLDDLRTLDTTLPIILYNRNVDDYHCVYCDYDAVIEKIAASLLKKAPDSITFVCDKSHYLAGSYRMQHTIEVCRNLHIADGKISIIEAEDSCEGGAEAGKKLLQFDKLPALVICATDSIAIGCSHSLQTSGLHIPKDISLFCFGLADPQLAEYSLPSLSVIELPTDQLTSGILQIISDLTDGGLSQKIRYRYEPVLHVRQTYIF